MKLKSLILIGWWFALMMVNSFCLAISPEDHILSPSEIPGFDDSPELVSEPFVKPTPISNPVHIHNVSIRPRYALVIGNAGYQQGRLKNPRNDARGVSGALKRLNFDVTLVLDASHKRMRTSIEKFSDKLHSNTVGLFYYSGHGVQHQGENYLIPIGAMRSSIQDPKNLRYDAVNVAFILDKMEKVKSELNIVILDACRDNPYSHSRSTRRGLALMPAPVGSFIAYATAPGRVARDGLGNNSPFTKYLLDYMEQPNLTIDALFKRVIAGVKQDTQKEQVPWYNTSIDRDFYFVIDQSRDFIE